MKLIFLFITFFGAILKADESPTFEAEAFSGRAKAQPTIVYLVRHAEKVTTDPHAKDPDLTAAGYARAEALKQYFENIPVDAFFTSPYTRTRKTLEPLAAGHEIITYDTHNYTFKVTLRPGKKPQAEVATYGVPTT
jgi:hypothetical protein